MDEPFASSLRLLAALLAGGLIGLNRDMYGKPTGVRVHALVALGAALLTLAGDELGDAGATSRIIQGITGGIGFLGAGVIMHDSAGKRALHLVTASSIWMTAALGVACGCGAWRLAALGAGATLLVLGIGKPIDRALYRRLARPSSDADPAA
ncbi:MAG TPA: MgtC/SapB family protein [Anaeromyxobacteraceae bacterium]|jgi:putative Mg2+ transporter-C (MgtC) family protein|nr:MgtC/SapB family protein [Anaeromyxobacteraceae bacterium]